MKSNAMFRMLLMALPWMPALASGQAVPLGAPRLRPSLQLGTIGIAVNPATLNLELAPSGASVAKSIGITTTVSGIGVVDTLNLVAYFPSTTALTTTGGDTILSSQVLASCATCLPTNFTPVSQSSSFAPASSLVLLNQFTALTVLGGSRTDTVNLKVDLTNSPQAPAGTYTGTLVFAAQIF